MSKSYQPLTVNSKAKSLEAGSVYAALAGLLPESGRDNWRSYEQKLRTSTRSKGLAVQSPYDRIRVSSGNCVTPDDLRQKLHYFTVLSIVSNAAKFVKIGNFRLEQNPNNWKMAFIYKTLKSRGAFREKAQQLS